MSTETIDWENILSRGFSFTQTDYIFALRWNADSGWDFQNAFTAASHIVPYAPLQVDPAAVVLNYGQGLLEGAKALRHKDGSIHLFRPHFHAARLNLGAQRFHLPQLPPDNIVDAMKAVVNANERWVPPSSAPGAHSTPALYLRPLLFGTEARLGVTPANEAMLVIFASPVGSYFGGSPKTLLVQRQYHRAVRGGVGGVKAIGNYAPCFEARALAKRLGHAEVLYLDQGDELCEEAGAGNFFAIDGASSIVYTPGTDARTLLAGVTRASIVELAVKANLTVEYSLPLSKLRDCSEAFLCGTGAGVTPISGVSDYEKDEKVTFPSSPGKWTMHFAKLLTGIQTGSVSDSDEWLLRCN